jgi:hypothetical protein
MVVYQLRLHRSQRLVEEDHRLDHTAVVEAERMASMGVVTLDMVEEEEEEGGLTTEEMIGDSVEVCHRENGEEAKHHQTATLASEGDEGEVTAVTGVVEEEVGGSRVRILMHWTVHTGS